MKKYILHFTLFIFVIGCSKEINYLPETLFEYKLEKKLDGEEAKNFVNKLHFNEVTDLQNEIAFYQKENKNLTIYITHYNSQEEALKDEIKMTDKISPENSVFIAGKYFQVNNKNVYECFGMGQAHYVFSSNGKLFWISVDSVTGRDFLKNYLELIEN